MRPGGIGGSGRPPATRQGEQIRSRAAGLRRIITRQELDTAVSELGWLKSRLGPVYSAREYEAGCLTVAELAREQRRWEIAADHFLKALEQDSRDRDSLIAIEKLRLLSEEKKLGGEARRRVEAYFRRVRHAELSEERPQWGMLVYLLAIQTLTNNRQEILDFGERVYGLFPDTDSLKSHLAQNCLFNSRVVERYFGRALDRERLRRYAERVVNDRNFHDLSDPDIFRTVTVDIYYFGFNDLLARLMERPEKDEQSARFYEVVQASRRFHARVAAACEPSDLPGVAVEAAALEDQLRAAVVVPAEISPILLGDYQVLYGAFRHRMIAVFGLDWNQLSFAPRSDREMVLTGTAEEYPELARQMAQRTQALIEPLNRYLNSSGRGPHNHNYLFTSYSIRATGEAGQVECSLPAFSPEALLAIKIKSGTTEYILRVSLPVRHGKVAAAKFGAETPLLISYFELNALSGLLLEIGRQTENHRLIGLGSMVGEVDREIDKQVALIQAGRLARQRTALILHFVNQALAAEPVLMTRETEMLARYFEARDVVDRFAGRLNFTSLTYQLVARDYLFDQIEKVVVRPETGTSFLVQLHLRNLPANLIQEPVVLRIKIDNDRVEFVDAPGLREEDLCISVCKDFIVAQLFEVLARYLGAQILPQRYAGYVVLLDGGFQVLSETADGVGLPSFGTIFNQAFDQFLKTQGITACDLFEKKDGLFLPLRAGTAAEKTRLIAERGKAAVYIAEQMRGQINRLPVRQIRRADSRLVLGAYHGTDQAIRQKDALGDRRPLPKKIGVYVVTNFPDGSNHLFPVLFRDDERELLAPGPDGKDLLDRITQAVREGKYRDPKSLLRTSHRSVRERVGPKFAAGGFTQEAATFDVEYTYYRPDFVSVAELLERGYNL